MTLRRGFRLRTSAAGTRGRIFVHVMLLGVALLSWSACKPHALGEGASDAAPSTSTSTTRPAIVNADASAPNAPKRANASAQGESFDVESWSFELTRTNVTIADLQMTSGLARVVREKNATLATNGGFFGTHDEPIGLAVSEGHALSKFSPQLSGGVLRIENDRASLDETESFDAGISSSFAIQCKPRLVVKSAVNVKRDDGHRAERTALCIRDQGRTLDVVLARNVEGGPSLFAFATHLANAGCEDALNLDGGPSTGVAYRDLAGVKEERPRGPLRHAIVLAPK